MDRRVFILSGMTAFATTSVSAKPRRAHWAQPIELTGAENLHRVSHLLYRSAQPTAQGFRNLANKRGIKTIINLHDEEPDDALARGTGLRLVHVKTSTITVFMDGRAKLVRALREIRKAMKRGPVLVHCVYGKDRTGAVIAAWRMLEQGWTAEAAVDEMTNGGFGYNKYLLNFGTELKSLDIKALRQQVAER